MRAAAMPHDLVDVPGELGIGHTQPLLAVLVDCLDRPTGIEFRADLGEVGDECDAANTFHMPPIG